MVVALGAHLGACGDEDGVDLPDAQTLPADGGAAVPDASVRDDGAVGPREDGGPPVGPPECSNGADDDGDGLVDWPEDFGCYGPDDPTERALPRDEEDGFSTFEPDPDSRVVYVSNDGDDDDDGLSPESAVRTLARGAELVRDGEYDFLLLRRGDSWSEGLGRFKSGRDATHPLVVASYGEGAERPLIDYDGRFIGHAGGVRSHLAILGLHFRPAGQLPTADEPGHVGAALRLVGGGDHILIEGCHFEYTELVLQSFDGGVYRDVEVRRNVFERAYHADTCAPGNPNGNAAHRPSGIFAQGVERLTIEENVFDHNGWNVDRVASACATIYNHNVYLPRNRDLRVVGNFFARPSSIHIKLTGSVEEPTDGYRIENNYLVGGEIGISAGGNSEGGGRFKDGVIRNNVLSDVGDTPPTGRNLAWGLEIIDNRDTVVEGNFLLNHRAPDSSNSWALRTNGDTNRGVRIEDNVFFRIQRRGLRATRADGHEGVEVIANTFVDPGFDSCLVIHENGFGGYTYRDNRYYSAADGGEWFCEGSARRSLDEWVGLTGETGAEVLTTVPFSDPDRSVETYAATLGLEPTLEAFLVEARAQSRERWRVELMADAVNRYVRQGFE